MLSSEMKKRIAGGEFDGEFARICVCEEKETGSYRDRIVHAVEEFETLYGTDRDVYLFSAPGRTEVGGNHTDHQRGRVLAASVNLDVIAVVAKSGNSTVRLKSEGHSPNEVDISDAEPVEAEKNTSNALLRGVCARFKQLGYPVGGFDAYTTSNVLAGSGLSSSAAFEVLVGTIVNGLFEGKESALSIAQIGQYAENVYFDKPSGLMDQAASSVGGFIQIDFADREHPEVRKVDFDFAACGYALCIIDTRGSHADLTPDYAAIPEEMRTVAACFDKEVLREVDEAEFYRNIPLVREKAGDRAVLRAMHFFAENDRVLDEADALRRGDFDAFRALVLESGASSYQYLQNVFSVSHPQQQGVSLVLALCQRHLAGCGGAWRVHGGGFAGTVQAFVPLAVLPGFIEKIEAVIGEGSCHSLRIRPVGGVQII